MKKTQIITLLILLASLGLVACSQGGQPSTATGSESPSQASSEVSVVTSQEGAGGSAASESAGAQESPQSSPSLDAGVSYNGHYYSVEGKDGPVIIANKHYPLAADYNPGENPQALAALQNLIAQMQAEGFAVSDQYSGFRSYDTQAQLYQNYVNQDGQAAADRYSARPGYSEHQTGLAFDLIDSNGNLLQEEHASKWLLQHAADYGFIVRYLAGKESSTGYMKEEWHLRYIGQEAKDIAASGKTLEEYYGFTGGDYEK